MQGQSHFYIRGFTDYPSSQNYPTQDRYGPTEEAEYIRGWRARSVQEQAEEDYDGRDIWPGY